MWCHDAVSKSASQQASQPSINMQWSAGRWAEMKTNDKRARSVLGEYDGRTYLGVETGDRNFNWSSVYTFRV